MKSPIIISSPLLLFTSLAFAQPKEPDTIAFKKDFEKLLGKYGIDSKRYFINVTSTNQSGGQTAFIINNNYYADSVFDPSNFIYSVKNEGAQSILSVAPKKGVWTLPFVLTDSLKYQRNFFDPGPGFNTIIHGLTISFEGKTYTLAGQGKTTACSRSTPLLIRLDPDDATQFYIFGDLNEPNRIYIYRNGKVEWAPSP